MGGQLENQRRQDQNLNDEVRVAGLSIASKLLSADRCCQTCGSVHLSSYEAAGLVRAGGALHHLTPNPPARRDDNIRAPAEQVRWASRRSSPASRARRSPIIVRARPSSARPPQATSWQSCGPRQRSTQAPSSRPIGGAGCCRSPEGSPVAERGSACSPHDEPPPVQQRAFLDAEGADLPAWAGAGRGNVCRRRRPGSPR